MERGILACIARILRCAGSQLTQELSMRSAAADWGLQMSVVARDARASVLLVYVAPLCGIPWGCDSSPHWGLMLAQSRCGRWLLYACMLPDLCSAPVRLALGSC